MKQKGKKNPRKQKENKTAVAKHFKKKKQKKRTINPSK